MDESVLRGLLTAAALGIIGAVWHSLRAPRKKADEEALRRFLLNSPSDEFPEVRRKMGLSSPSPETPRGRSVGPE